MTSNNSISSPTTTTTELQDYVLEVFNKIAKDEGFSNFKIIPSSGSNHGDGFMGIMLRVIIRGERRGKSNDELSLMLKMPPISEARKKQFNSYALFEREIVMYDFVLPAFIKFQNEKGLTADNGIFNSFPKCYATVFDKEQKRYALVLEDLKIRGYDMFNRFKTIDLEHVKFVMEELGKFHAISFAMRDQKPDIFKKISKLKDVFLDHMRSADPMKGFQNITFDRAISTLDKNDVVAIEKITKMKTNFLDIMSECVELSENEPFTVVNHGDCWNNNMMYLYNGKTFPEKLCFIDFQIARCASPVLDLTYFFFTSTNKKLRDDHYEEILQIYYNSLKEHIGKLGSNADKLFTYDDLQKQFLKFGKYGLLMAPLILQVVSADPTDIPDMDAMAEEMDANKGKPQTNAFYSAKTAEAYNTKIRDVINDAIRWGYY